MNFDYFFTSYLIKRSPKQFLTERIHRKQYVSNYQNYIHFAEQIVLEQDCKFALNAINKLIRILSLNAQNNIINRTLQYENRPPDDAPFFIISPAICQCCFQRINEPKAFSIPISISFDISTDPTISYPWNQKRLMNCLGSIGQKLNNPFVFDNMNHFDSLLISPINLLIIGNGYHSSTVGIYDTNAIYHPEYIMDISTLYNDIYFDGIAFRHKECNWILEYPLDKSIGIIYEIGRILYQNNLNLLSLDNPELVSLLK